MVTVATVLAQNQLALRPVHVPAPDLDVRWVATSELLDPAPFLEGGEILLTTGLEARGWRREWDAYVERLAEVGIAALGFGTGLTHAKVPAGLIRACEAHGLNLIEVPRATPFVAISRRTAELLQQDEAEAAREALKVQRRLTAAAAKPDAATAVIETLAHVLGGAAGLLSPDGQAILGPLGERRDELFTPEVAQEIRRLRHQGLRAASTISTEAATTVVHPLGLGGRPSSYLAAVTAGRVSVRQRSAITTAVALLGLIGEQERTSVETRRQLRSRAIELLVSGDSRTARLVLDVEQQTADLPAHIRLLRATGGRNDVEDALATLEQQRLLAADLAEELCVVAPEGRAASLASSLADAGLLVGIGEAVPLNTAAASYATAGHALDQATPSSKVVQWERILGEGPLSLIDRKRAEAFAASFLGGLDHEELETLRCFLRHHGSRLKVADELGLHRNTVRNRLEAIEAKLPGPLDDPQTRVSAWIALQSLPTRGGRHPDGQEMLTRDSR
jgi:PucR family transcriptional regulator, purine catabolism regulatory protein